MPREAGVLGIFLDPATAARGILAVRAAGCREVRAAMPAPFPEVMAAIGRRKSPLGMVTFAGAVLGLTGGFALCILTSLDWPLVVGGKPIVALPSFAVIGFEITVLVGVVITVAALAILVSRARGTRALPEDPRFSADHIGIFALGGDAAALEVALRANGAKEVRRVE